MISRCPRPPQRERGEQPKRGGHTGGQAEVDHYWTSLSDGGEEGPCGWLEDCYGLSWQIVPDILNDVISDPDRARAERAMQAMLGMRKRRRPAGGRRRSVTGRRFHWRGRS